MKYLEEFRDPKAAKKLLEEIGRETKKSWSIMEVCGGQTHSLVKNGILDLLPEKISLIHGPGCPVCVTPMALIDKAVAISGKPDVILTSFGDMLRVPGTEKSLLKAKSEGADVRVVYSPIDAVDLAKNNPEKEVVFFAVGFETTAPANALAVIQAEQLGLKNFSILSSHVLVPPAIEAILNDPDCMINGFLAAGHVCTVMGLKEYYPVAEKYQVPIVATGFEPVDLLEGILILIKMLEKGEVGVANAYGRVVRDQGNPEAMKLLDKVYIKGDREWRGLGGIPQSGFHLNPSLDSFNAETKFPNLHLPEEKENGCISGQILKGVKKPFDCPFFGKGCTPQNPMGAPMVSSEGACAAYYHYKRQEAQA